MTRRFPRLPQPAPSDLAAMALLLYEQDPEAFIAQVRAWLLEGDDDG